MPKLPPCLTVVDHTARLSKRVEQLATTDVLVGIPASKGEHKSPDGTTHGISNALIGYLMERGMPLQNVPARPFLVPGVRDARERIDEYLRQAALAAMSGDVSKMRRCYSAAGLAASTAVKLRIQSGAGFDPLAPATVYRRKHRKVAPRSSDKPLMDTLQLLRSVTYVLRG